MSKTRTPFFSLGSRGTVAKTITTQKFKGATLVRTRPVPTDPKTPAQLAQRQRYRDAVAVWNALSLEEKEAWRGLCPGLTAYQCFMRSELKYEPPPPPPEPIEVGQPAIDRTGIHGYGRTMIPNIAADGSGKITEVQIWVNQTLVALELAIFEEISPDQWTTHDTLLVGNTGPGYHEIPVDFDITEGWFLGFFASSGTIEYDASGFEGVHHIVGDMIPCVDQWIHGYDDLAISLHGTGETD